MEVLLTNTATMQKTRNGFSVTMIHKKGCDDLLKLSFKGKIHIVDARYENFCFISFDNEKGERHTLAITDYEEPLLDGELMFI